MTTGDASMARDPEALPMGVETEYAFNVYGRDGEPLDRDAGLNDVLEQIRRGLVALPDEAAPGFFLENGARLYIDAGAHPEYSTPECANPHDVVRAILAGEAILSRLAEQIGSSARSAAIFRCNVDYETGATWGCHESYLHRGDQERMAEQLVPHLVTRLVYTGSGGFRRAPDGAPRFALSPRVAHLDRVCSPHSTENRGIFHTKDESLCGGEFHRLHVICSESLCSHVAIFVKIGATALIVRLIEAGRLPAEGFLLRAPLPAMKAIAADPTCTRRITTRRGELLTAIEIQRRYLEAVEKELGGDLLPDWAEDVCREWRGLLDLLAGGPEAVSRSLDWAIKLALYSERAHDRGGQLDALAAAPELCDELFEIDMRFGELSGRSIFAALDAADVLAHRVPGLGPLDALVSEPPAQGRAQARSKAIREAAGEQATVSTARGSRYGASWSRVVDRSQGRIFDLTDPFGRATGWRDVVGPPKPVRPRGRIEELRRQLRQRIARDDGLTFDPDQEEFPF